MSQRRFPTVLRMVLPFLILSGMAVSSRSTSSVDQDLPNPTELAPVIAKAWTENLDTARTLYWTETASISLDGFVQLSHVTENHFGSDGNLLREIMANQLHYQRKAGMKKRIRKNLELNGSDWIEKLSGLIAVYAYPNESMMEDWVSRSSMVVSGKDPYLGSWEIKTRRAANDNDELVQWVSPGSKRPLARSFHTTFEDEKVNGELTFYPFDKGIFVLRSARLTFPDQEGVEINFDFRGYGKRESTARPGKSPRNDSSE